MPNASQAALGCLLMSQTPPRSGLPPCAPSATSRELWLPVPLDWSAPEAHGALKIRYHMDSAHFDQGNPSSPIFLQLGGEGTTAHANCGELAARHGALCVSTEHRFYGLSVPSEAAGGCSDHNYKAGLSVQNALADAAAVVDAVRRAHAPPQRGARSQPRTVVAFGGSYAGGLCAWFRQAYRTHASGCVASSGVVNAVLDFDAFDLAVGLAVERTQPAAQQPPSGAACAAVLRAIAAATDRALDSGDGAELRARFNASGLRADALGDADLVYALADGVAMAVQYGAKRWLCEAFQAELASARGVGATDEQLLRALAGVLYARYGPRFASGCFYSSDCLVATAGLSPSAARRAGGGREGEEALQARVNSRAWRYQKCSQLAYLQRAPRGSAAPARLRSRRLSLEALLEQCEQVFPGAMRALPDANVAFNARFGGARPSSGAYPDSSAMLFLGFSDDPWQAATVPMARWAAPDEHSRLAEEAGTRSCFTECDGCGHCGAGVQPEAMARCNRVVEDFVRELVDIPQPLNILAA